MRVATSPSGSHAKHAVPRHTLSRRVAARSLLPAGANPHVLGHPKHFDFNGEKLAVPADVSPLFAPLKVGAFQLTNRLVYAPLTRCRAPNGVLIPEAATYYKQRANKGSLVISEATNISASAQGMPDTPGIWNKDQMKAWEGVVKGVHEKGATMVLQLWHTGRASIKEYQPDGRAPVSSSTVPIGPKFECLGPKYTMVPYPTPRALTKEEIKEVVGQYAQAAKNARDVGFDGVEIHGANGYLIDQFIKDSINKRTDEYGTSIENRCRFALEVTEAVVSAIGGERTGIRITPFTQFLDALDSTPYATHAYLCEKLNKFGLAYVHMVEARVAGAADVDASVRDSLAPFRVACSSPFIVAGGFTRDSGATAVANGYADLVCYGRHYLANPDLPKRFLLNAPLNPYDRATFVVGGAKGYTDYPTLEPHLAMNSVADN